MYHKTVYVEKVVTGQRCPVGSKKRQHCAGNAYVIQKAFNRFSALKDTECYKQNVYAA